MRLKLSALVAIAGEYGPPAKTGARAAQGFQVVRRLTFSDQDAAPTDCAFSLGPTITASGHLDLDLAAGPADALGLGLALAEVRAIFLTADPSNGADVLLGGAGAGAFAAPFGAADDALRCRPGGVLVLAAPAGGAWRVDAGASLLRLSNTDPGSAASLELVLVGAAAQTGTIGFDFSDPGQALGLVI